MAILWQKWATDETELLKVHWESSDMETLLKTFPNRNYSSLMQKARELRVTSKINRKRIGSLKYLDELNKDNAYWWGFIMADGHITHQGELIISLANRDKNHLQKLGTLLNKSIKEKEKFSILRIQDHDFGKKWLTILQIDKPKTYYPPNLSIFYTKEYLLPFFIGLIDGDGCIWESKKWLNLRVELHGNWYNTLQEMSNKLKEFYDINCKVKTTIRNDGKFTARIDINTKKDLFILKEYSKNVNCLERKWSILDSLNF